MAQQLESSVSSALCVLQFAGKILAEWSKLEVCFQLPEKSDASLFAKKIMDWPDENISFSFLEILFNQINIKSSTSTPPKVKYWPPVEIENENPVIPYPITQVSNQDLESLKKRIKASKLPPGFWQRSDLLMLFIEKYGSHISLGDSSIAFSDLVRMTAALAAALSTNPTASELSLIGADLSGIQDFIYTISSIGALKSLRARSFYLELVAEEVVQQLLHHLELPRSNVIYSGGGKVYLLAPKTAQDTLVAISDRFNDWLLGEFQSKVSLSLGQVSLPVDQVNGSQISKYWNTLNQKLAIQKQRKFSGQLKRILEITDAHGPCKVCHRDDVETLQPLEKGGNDAIACCVCKQMYDLGQQLFGIKAIVRSGHQLNNTNAKRSLKLNFDSQPIYYYLFQEESEIPKNAGQILLINNWSLDSQCFQKSKSVAPLMLGNYGQDQKDETGENFRRFMRVEEFAQCSQGIKRVGYLRMDVDRLGRIFVDGFSQSSPSLMRLASLSRLLNYFFKVYLTSLANDRDRNLPEASDRHPVQKLSNQARKDLLFIYAGGDDVFISGAWDQIVEFSGDLYQSFRAYTGQHPDITLSAGIELSTPKFPIYQAAKNAGDAETLAKNAGRDRLCLFGQVFTWGEWLGLPNQVWPEVEKYNTLEPKPSVQLLGILPIVKQINQNLGQAYSQNFVRNLLNIAQTQERMAEAIAKKNPTQSQDIRHVLHLPKIAYMLARLPTSVRQSKNFPALRSALLTYRNAKYLRAIATWISLLNRDSSSAQLKKNNA